MKKIEAHYKYLIATLSRKYGFEERGATTVKFNYWDVFCNLYFEIINLPYIKHLRSDSNASDFANDIEVLFSPNLDKINQRYSDLIFTYKEKIHKEKKYSRCLPHSRVTFRFFHEWEEDDFLIEYLSEKDIKAKQIREYYTES